ncbi:MAG: hypothetical protein ABL865_07680 [Candidatus Nitrotoga sp.]
MEDRRMTTHHGMLKRIAKLGLLLMLGMSMRACGNSTSWKEEVLLHDGSKIVVQRSQSYGGRHEIGQSPPIKTQEITFPVPNTGKVIRFKSEFGKDIGRSNFKLFALLEAVKIVTRFQNIAMMGNAVKYDPFSFVFEKFMQQQGWSF